MKVLVVNCGSSTLKFRFLEVEADSIEALASGAVERIGGRAALEFTGSGSDLRTEADAADHSQAARLMFRWLDETGLAGQVEAVGHRVVHGGDRFWAPALIDAKVVAAIEELTDLAPLHNGPTLQAIHSARRELGRDIPMVAVFDTAFHRTLPERAALYPLPLELSERRRVRRYGFHGLAHRYMTERYAELAGRPLDRVKLVTLQLGQGCSATAVDGGRSVDTSMGFTPLEGLMMGARSGDLDPSLVGYLTRQEDVNVEEVETWLNTRSGLLGVSGRSADVRDLLKAEADGDHRAALALEMFCYRVRKQVGAYLAALDGAEAVVFGGGIGENSPEVRSRVCEGLAWSGLTLDANLNRAAEGSEARISTQDSRLHAYVIPVDEAMIIARDTVECLREG